ncbi:MAG TPA: GH116 family glycosyl hydrolase [Candidatus Limnocylindrales bacterium]
MARPQTSSDLLGVAAQVRAALDDAAPRLEEGRPGRAAETVRPNGMVDTSSEQSQEVWVGTTYALAAFMISQGLRSEAWATESGVARVVKERGYWFRTPEAYDRGGDFRARLYLRPLAIWAIEHWGNDRG